MLIFQWRDRLAKITDSYYLYMKCYFTNIFFPWHADLEKTYFVPKIVVTPLYQMAWNFYLPANVCMLRLFLYISSHVMIQTVSQVAGFCHSSSNLTMQIIHLLINLKRTKVGLRTSAKDTWVYCFLPDRIQSTFATCSMWYRFRIFFL